MLKFTFLKRKFVVFLGMAFIFPLTLMSCTKDINVTYENFVQVETSMQMYRYQEQANGINKLYNLRVPTQYNAQTTIRMNRDTLYSFAVVNIKDGAEITLPESGNRYISLMPINELGYTNKVWYGAGKHKITPDIIGSDYVIFVVRILVNANDPSDVKKANELQDMIKIQAADATAYVKPNWNIASYDKIYASLIEMARLLPNSNNVFGSKDEVDPLRHVVGTTAGFGGLPTKDAYYIINAQKPEQANYKIELKDVPVDGFWSFTVYDKAGYLFESEKGLSSINNLTAKPSENGLYTIYFGNCSKEKVNCLATKDGWNYVVRLYQPRKEIISGEWVLPDFQKSE